MPPAQTSQFRLSLSALEINVDDTDKALIFYGEKPGLRVAGHQVRLKAVAIEKKEPT